MNYIKIYNSKLTYYTNIVANTYSLINLQKTDITLFTIIFTDIIYTYLSTQFFNYTNNNTIFIEPLNVIIQQYMKYNFSFSLGGNSISNVDNLVLQGSLKKESKNLTTLSKINLFIQKLYFYELYGIDIANANLTTTQGDFIIFTNNLGLNSNYNFEYNYFLINFVHNLYNFITLLSWYISVNYNVNTNINSSIINNLQTALTDEIGSVDSIDNYMRESYIFYSNKSSTFIYSNIINTVTYNDFINRFSSCVKIIVNYSTNTSVTSIFTQVYNQYFSGVTFQYKVYAQNQFIYKTYSISITQLEQYIYSYLLYKISPNNDSSSNQNFENIFNQIITVYFQDISTEILINLYTWLTGIIIPHSITRNNLNDLLNDYIYKLLTNNIWGIVYQENNINYVNKDLFIQVLLLNYDTMITNNPALTPEYIFNKNYKLELLYKIFILTQMIIPIIDTTYQELFLAILLNCNQFVYKGLLINTINLQNDISIELDYTNKNIIPANNISNYYKSISNDTIKNIVSYGVLNYVNKFLPDNFLQGFYAWGAPNTQLLPQIYNVLNINFNLTDETSILKTFFQNSIVGIMDQYNSSNDIIVNYNITTLNTPYIKNVFSYALSTINTQLLVLQNVCGGVYNGNASATLNIGQILNIFSTGNYKLSNSSVTVFTMCYKNLSELSIDNVEFVDTQFTFDNNLFDVVSKLFNDNL